jgi:glucose-1-phosphate cytidylyltransferase
MSEARPPVVILCGGRGTRLRERTREIPKPLVEIGGRPIVQHVIELYAAQGFRRFLLATGYRGELIERFVAAHSWPAGIEVLCVDTGLDTPTGGRIKLLAEPALAVGARRADHPAAGGPIELLGPVRAPSPAAPGGAEGAGGRIDFLGPVRAPSPAAPGGVGGAGGRIDFLEPLRARAPHARDGTFCVTYADGLADIDLGRLLAFHERHGALATMSVVRPELQFGVAELDGRDGRVLGFREKPRSEHWVNGGFFCLRMGALEYLEHDSVLERQPLQRLAAAGELRAYRHEGFWECMDTYKDAVALNDLWASGAPPWVR